MIRLGINTVHLNIEEIMDLGLNRVEFVLGRGKSYEEMNREVLKGITLAEEINLPYSIHLPIYTFEWYQEDYLSAFFLDPDDDKRESSFRLLDANLSKLDVFNPEYYIIHFQGVYKFEQNHIFFEERLKTTLDRINEMAKKYKVKILLEYFGSNYMFYKIDDWINKIDPYSNLGILCDTGHLYFSSLMHDFVFLEGLEKLAAAADAFHIWTTKGDKSYSDSEYYTEFHHIVAHMNQRKDQGFAFDVDKMMDIVSRYDSPIIIEASEKYRGREYFIEGIKSIVSYFANR
ncbi:MAG: sugar phosphate isomerase/epimerase [Clostridiales bacterium]|nr:sugar phosphate isomerase/epimerase [Clostridiales bacterium]